MTGRGLQRYWNETTYSAHELQPTSRARDSLAGARPRPPHPCHAPLSPGALLAHLISHSRHPSPRGWRPGGSYVTWPACRLDVSSLLGLSLRPNADDHCELLGRTSKASLSVAVYRLLPSPGLRALDSLSWRTGRGRGQVRVSRIPETGAQSPATARILREGEPGPRQGNPQWDITTNRSRGRIPSMSHR